MGEPRESVAEIITKALKYDKMPDRVASLVTGAMRVTDNDDGAAAIAQKRAYLKAITVEGFRGSGPKITLALRPGPGLTVVTGRNGSGKSSFAEAAELALTGENKRWSDRTAVWKEGWQNLHHRTATAIAVRLTEDGEPGTTTVTREWPAGAALDQPAGAIPPLPLLLRARRARQRPAVEDARRAAGHPRTGRSDRYGTYAE